MSYSDQQLRDAVDAVFGQFDKDGSNTLDPNEVANLINAALAQMNAGRQCTQEEVQALIDAVDKNGDGKIAKPELYEIFKRVAQQWSHIMKYNSYLPYLMKNLISHNFIM